MKQQIPIMQMYSMKVIWWKMGCGEGKGKISDWGRTKGYPHSE